MNVKITWVLIALVVFSAGCILDGSEVKELEDVEVEEYEGEDLSKAEDVRDVSIKGSQNIDIETYQLEVAGLIESPVNYTYDEVLGRQKYSKVVTIHCVLGWDATVLWEGILVRDLLEEASPKPEANTVIFHAYDGYTTSFPLDYFTERDIIMAYKINNATLPAAQGYPFILVAEDKWGYKWIKWITKIELTDDPTYRGYWESRGYSQTADLDEPFFE